MFATRWHRTFVKENFPSPHSGFCLCYSLTKELNNCLSNTKPKKGFWFEAIFIIRKPKSDNEQAINDTKSKQPLFFTKKSVINPRVFFAQPTHRDVS